MKQPLIITTGIVIILFVLGMWVYLLVYGSPEKGSEVFSNLGFIGSTETPTEYIPPVVIDENTSQLSLGNARLEQLTTKAVAGSTFSSSTRQLLWYAEMGTGHIFEIDLETGIERQVSLTTIPQTSKAVFSPIAVAITSYEGYNKNTIAGIITEDGSPIDFVKLPVNAENVKFNDLTELYYTRTIDNQTVGYTFDIETITSKELFRVEIPDIKTTWGYPLIDINVSTKPSKEMEGFSYRVVNNKLIPASDALYGLVSLFSNVYTVNSFIIDDEYVTESILEENNTVAGQPILMLPEKCVFREKITQNILCASPMGNQNAEYVESWYKGLITSKDILWEIDLDQQKSELVADFSELSGRVLDVSEISLNDDEDLLLITNKADQTLWLYRL